MDRSAQKMNDRYSEPGPRPHRRKVGAGVALLLAVMMAWAVTKHCMTGDLATSQIEAGIVDLHRAVKTGDPAAFQLAEDHFVDASSVSPIDRYPAFLIRASQRIEVPEQGPHDAVARAVRQRDFAAARERAAALGEPGSKGREYWERLIDAMESLDQSAM